MDYKRSLIFLFVEPVDVHQILIVCNQVYADIVKHMGKMEIFVPKEIEISEVVV